MAFTLQPPPPAAQARFAARAGREWETQLRAGRPRRFACKISISPDMRLLSKILWLLAFLAATFCWMVLFEHGFSMKGFSQGVREEWQALSKLVTGKLAQ